MIATTPKPTKAPKDKGDVFLGPAVDDDDEASLGYEVAGISGKWLVIIFILLVLICCAKVAYVVSHMDFWLPPKPKVEIAEPFSDEALSPQARAKAFHAAKKAREAREAAIRETRTKKRGWSTDSLSGTFDLSWMRRGHRSRASFEESKDEAFDPATIPRHFDREPGSYNMPPKKIRGRRHSLTPDENDAPVSYFADDVEHGTPSADYMEVVVLADDEIEQAKRKRKKRHLSAIVMTGVSNPLRRRRFVVPTIREELHARDDDIFRSEAHIFDISYVEVRGRKRRNSEPEGALKQKCLDFMDLSIESIDPSFKRRPKTAVGRAARAVGDAAHGVEHTIEDQLHAVANKLHAAEHRVDEAAHRAAPKTMHVVDEVKHKVHDAEHAVADKIHAVGDKIHAAEHKLEDAIHHRVDEAKHRIELARADAKRKAELFKRRFERHGRHR